MYSSAISNGHLQTKLHLTEKREKFRSKVQGVKKTCTTENYFYPFIIARIT